jgi:hypothetical protein
MIKLLTPLLPLVAPALRYADNPQRPLWRLDLLVYTVLVAVADVALAHLFFSPRKGEWTISHTLERTAKTSVEHRTFALLINHYSPAHIKAVL